MEIFGPGLALLTLLGSYGYWKKVGQNESYVRKLCSGMLLSSPRKAPEGESLTPGWRHYFYGGIFEYRRVEVHYQYRMNFHWPQPKEFPIHWPVWDELEVRIPVIQKFWLRMLPQKAERDEQDEIIVENKMFDRAFRIFSNQREAATEFLKSHLIQEQFRTFPFTMDRLEIHRGWLHVAFSQARENNLRRSDFESILHNLMLVLTVYENYSYRLEIRNLESNKTCPYCRGEMNESEAIVQCQLCSTRLHKACWSENKQCTTWGCNSTESK